MSFDDPHPASASLAYSGIGDLIQQYASGETSTVEVVETLLGRIAAIDAADTEIALRAVLAVDATASLQAAAIDERRGTDVPTRPLEGVPILVKDNIQAIGLPGSAGSLALADSPATQDAPLVTLLRDAGAVILGSTNLSEWANFRGIGSISGWSAVGGLTGNPWALDRSAGGSSSGSGAAVAAGLAPIAIGSETNGSITCPASFNGVVGFKPAVGSVPAEGIVPISASQDVPGPIGRGVRDVACVAEVLLDRNDLIAAIESASTVRVGVATAWGSGHSATDNLAASVLAAATASFAELHEVVVPVVDETVGADQVAILVGEFAEDLDAYLSTRDGAAVRSMTEVIAFNDANGDRELAYFGHEFLTMSVASGGRGSDDYQAARDRAIVWATGALDSALGEGVDVLVAAPYGPAWKSDYALGDAAASGGSICMAPALLGWPILTVPIGLVHDLPVAISITGRPGSEPALFAVGAAIEAQVGLLVDGRLTPLWRSPSRG